VYVRNNTIEITEKDVYKHGANAKANDISFIYTASLLADS